MGKDPVVVVPDTAIVCPCRFKRAPFLNPPLSQTPSFNASLLKEVKKKEEEKGEGGVLVPRSMFGCPENKSGAKRRSVWSLIWRIILES